MCQDRFFAARRQFLEIDVEQLVIVVSRHHSGPAIGARRERIFAGDHRQRQPEHHRKDLFFHRQSIGFRFSQP